MSRLSAGRLPCALGNGLRNSDDTIKGFVRRPNVYQAGVSVRRHPTLRFRTGTRTVLVSRPSLGTSAAGLSSWPQEDATRRLVRCVLKWPVHRTCSHLQVQSPRSALSVCLLNLTLARAAPPLAADAQRTPVTRAPFMGSSGQRRQTYHAHHILRPVSKFSLEKHDKRGLKA